MKIIKNLKTEVNRYQKIAQATKRKYKRINIRIAAKDLEEIQKKHWKKGFLTKRSSQAFSINVPQAVSLEKILAP